MHRNVPVYCIGGIQSSGTTSLSQRNFSVHAFLRVKFVVWRRLCYKAHICAIL